MFYYVYVLESLKAKNRLYIGSTHDLKKRVERHNRASNFSTKPYVPWKLIFYESYLNKHDAIRRESYLKTSQGARLLKRMLKEYLYESKN
jgi:putative endonuclease